MNAISVNVRNAPSLSGDENSASPAERPTADSPSPPFSNTAGKNLFKRQPALEIPGMNDRCWDRLFDQLIARVDALIHARHGSEDAPIPNNSESQSNSADSGNPGNANDPICQLKEVLDALAESTSAGLLDASQDLDEPEWSDSDTAREMQRNRGDQ